MRAALDINMEAARVQHGPWASSSGYGLNGAFMVMGPKGAELRIIASDGADPDAQGWEHVSVSCASLHRCPNWPEMCWVKDQFWGEEETVIQFHPPRSEYVNHHPTTLHLWRNRTSAIATPPTILVGPK